MVCCHYGHTNIAKWLSTQTIINDDTYRRTFKLCCEKGHFGLAKWIHTKCEIYDYNISLNVNQVIYEWLIYKVIGAGMLRTLTINEWRKWYVGYCFERWRRNITRRRAVIQCLVENYDG